MPSAIASTSAYPVVLVVRSVGQGEYSVARDGQVLSWGRRALSSSLGLLRLGGLPKDATLVVCNADTGIQSLPITLDQTATLLREGSLPVPQSKRELARRRREEKLRGLQFVPIDPSSAKPVLSPFRGGPSGVWIDQRGKARCSTQVG